MCVNDFEVCYVIDLVKFENVENEKEMKDIVMVCVLMVMIFVF